MEQAKQYSLINEGVYQVQYSVHQEHGQMNANLGACSNISIAILNICAFYQQEQAVAPGNRK